MTYRTIITDAVGPAQIIRLSRPEASNALSLELLGELQNELQLCDENTSIRGIVITGSEKVFSAGADLNEAAPVVSFPDSLRYLSRLRKAASIIEEMTKPVIAAISGYCLTGGLELALACDLRFATIGSRFAVTSASIGSSPGMGATQRLPRVVGSSKAKDMLFTGRSIEAVEALEIGLIDRLCEPGDVLSESIKWIDKCALQAPLSVWLSKYAVNFGINVDLASGLVYESFLAALAFGTDDKHEGMTAFLEKRKASFKGQ